MTIRDYVEVLLRRKWVIIITFAVVMIIAVAATLLATPKYQASTILRVLAISGGGSADWVSYDTKQIERLMTDRSLDVESARQRVSAQPPQSVKINLADVVIDTSGDLSETRRQVETAWQAIDKGGSCGLDTNVRGR